MLKREISIYNFGPLNELELDLNKNITVLIGAQASGKSTVSKVIYFCLKIKDYLYDFLNEKEKLSEIHPNEYSSGFRKYLRAKFIGIFGKTTHMRYFKIIYKLGDEEIRISLGKDKYVFFSFSNNLNAKISNIINKYANLSLELKGVSLENFVNDVQTINLLKAALSKEIDDTFFDEREIIYVPAGRSLLSTLCEKLRDFSWNDIDLTMCDFLELIDNTRRKFGNKIPEMVEVYLKTEKGQINNAATDYAYQLIKKILRADYVSDSDGEKMYFDDYHWVQLMFASSGQQEALWILMLLFSKILERQQTYFIIEEPEAHLFPMAQKYMSELIALCSNSTSSNILITTHSPYILTSFNVLLYSNKIENNNNNKSKGTVIPKLCRLRYKDFAALFIDNEPNHFNIISLLDEKTGIMNVEFIDSVSEITNSELEKLLEMEVKYDL